MGKRIVICCDGTWQSFAGAWPTNVQRTAQLVLPRDGSGRAQLVHYDAGIGAYAPVGRLMAGAFGAGLGRQIARAYLFLCINHEPGDEIFLFGFSRGAFAARSLGGLIGRVGLVPRHRLRRVTRALALYRSGATGPKLGPVPPITFVGLWDCVGALGIPNLLDWLPLDRLTGPRFAFHDTGPGPHVLLVRHALALDERRAAFAPVKVRASAGTDTEERWFPGDHGAVGGGARVTRGLADGALLWVLGEAGRAGLHWDRDLAADHLRPDHLGPLRERPEGPRPFRRDRRGPGCFVDVAAAARLRWAADPLYRPAPLTPHAAQLDGSAAPPLSPPA